MEIKEIEQTFPNPGRGPDYAVHFVRLKDGERAVWKPNMAADFDAIVPLRESLAYQVDRIIDAGLVPETEVHCHDGKWGVLQRFAEDAVDGNRALARDKPKFRFECMQRLGVLDFICSNPDRGPTNWLVNPDGSLVAIDNGGAFQRRDSFTWSVATIMGRPLSEEAKALVKNAYDRIVDICNAMLSIEYTPTKKVIKGLDEFDVAAKLAVNHTHVLAAACGFTDDRRSTLGLVNCRDIGIDIESMKKEVPHA